MDTTWIVCDECGDNAVEIEGSGSEALDGATIQACECECSCGVAGVLHLHDDDERQWLRFHPTFPEPSEDSEQDRDADNYYEQRKDDALKNES